MTKRILISQTPELVGETIFLQGWAEGKRDHGKVTFIDLRDRSGVIQCVGVGMMGEVTAESVISITGLVKQRPEKLINPKLKTGSVEIEVKSYEVLNKSKELPIPINTDGKEISEEPRLKYRYLDLRRSRLQKVMKMRSEFIRAIRDNLYTEDFVEIETPMLTKSTKEGARDFRS